MRVTYELLLCVHAAVRPAVRVQYNHLQIQEVHTCPHFNVQIYILFTSRIFYRFYLCPTLLLRLQTKTNRKNNSSTVHSFLIYNPKISMSSAASVYRNAFFTCREICLTKKLAQIGSPGRITMIQHQSVELGQLYNICRNQVFCRAVPVIHDAKFEG